MSWESCDLVALSQLAALRAATPCEDVLAAVKTLLQLAERLIRCARYTTCCAERGCTVIMCCTWTQRPNQRAGASCANDE